MQNVIFNGEKAIPGKIVCVGRNYVDHIKELDNDLPGEPVIFIKPNSAISTRLVAGSDEVIHYEAEIALLIQKGEFAGVGFGLDLTKRDLQAYLKGKGLPWERAKAFAGAALFSEFVPVDGDMSELYLQLSINDEIRQQGGVEVMIFKPAYLLEEISHTFSLQDNDIIMTGTPAGADAYQPGDHFTGRIYQGDKLLVEQSWQAV